MTGSDLRRGLTIDGRAIDRTVPAVQSGRRIIDVYFADGTRATSGARESVTVGGYREPLPAGPVLTGGKRFGRKVDLPSRSEGRSGR